MAILFSGAGHRRAQRADGDRSRARSIGRAASSTSRRRRSVRSGAVFAYNLVIVYHVQLRRRVPRRPSSISAALGAVVELVPAPVLRRAAARPDDPARSASRRSSRRSASGRSPSLPIWGDERDLASDVRRTQIVPGRSFDFHIGDLRSRSGLAHLLAFIVARRRRSSAIAAFLRFTRLGVAVRASAENTERAELLGINVRMLSTVVWTIAGALSGDLAHAARHRSRASRSGAAAAPTVLIAALAAGDHRADAEHPDRRVGRRSSSPSLQAAVGWSFRTKGRSSKPRCSS